MGDFRGKDYDSTGKSLFKSLVIQRLTQNFRSIFIFFQSDQQRCRGYEAVSWASKCRMLVRELIKKIIVNNVPMNYNNTKRLLER